MANDCLTLHLFQSVAMQLNCLYRPESVGFFYIVYFMIVQSYEYIVIWKKALLTITFLLNLL